MKKTKKQILRESIQSEIADVLREMGKPEPTHDGVSLKPERRELLDKLVRDSFNENGNHADIEDILVKFGPINDFELHLAQKYIDKVLYELTEGGMSHINEIRRILAEGVKHANTPINEESLEKQKL